MTRIYNDVAEYQKEKLCSGAMDLDWYLDDPAKAEKAAYSYIFHGSQYHSGNVQDNPSVGQNRLIDSVSFVERIVEAVDGNGDKMILGIAGYGAGKSHLALVLAELLSGNENISKRILQEIAEVDTNASLRIASQLSDDHRPFLVVPINGMRNSGLKDLFFSTLVRILDKDGVSKSCLNPFDTRFAYLRETVLNHRNESMIDSILHSAGVGSRSDFANKMDTFDEDTYKRVSNELRSNGVSLYPPASTGELKDLIRAVAEELCGDEKPYRGLFILFDEFGKYMSFAAANEAIAGAGIMQQLYEGVNSSTDAPVVLLGLSQLDLKEYQRGTGNLDVSNNMSRYVTRFDAAKKYYLSVCFESLVANLILVKDQSAVPSFNELHTIKALRQMHSALVGYFKASTEYPVWNSFDDFIRVICKGCWPLSPFALWTLSYVVSRNSILQQRSGFNIIANMFEAFKTKPCPESIFLFSAIDLYDNGLGEEFFNFEANSRTADQTASEYRFLCDKYAQQFTPVHHAVLKAIVLTHKLGAFCNTEQSSKELLCYLSGLPEGTINGALSELNNIFNAVVFNNALRLYDIRSDSMSIFEFKRKIEIFSKEFRYGKTPNELFRYVRYVFNQDYFTDIRDSRFHDVECDFAIEHSISSIEWYYKAFVVASNDYLTEIRDIINEKYSTPPSRFFDSKGTILYVIIPKSENFTNVYSGIMDIYKNAENKFETMLPVMSLLVVDEDGNLEESCIDLAMLDNLPDSAKQEFGTMIQKYRNELISRLDNAIEKGMQKKCYVYPDENICGSLRKAGSLIFNKIYPKAISFEIDGFSSESSNGGSSIIEFIGKLTKPGVSASSFNSLRIKEKNRCRTLLESGWGIFGSDGSVKKYPSEEVIKELFETIDKNLEETHSLSVYGLSEWLTKAPYGCNSSQATLLVFVYFSSRLLDLEFRNHGDLIELSSFVDNKTAFTSKTAAMVKKVWEGVEAVAAIHDDTKWNKLVRQWKVAENIQQIVSCYKEAEALLRMNITVPATLISDYSECMNKSREAAAQLDKWITESQSLEKKMYSNMENESVRRVLNGLCRYMSIYHDTIGSGHFSISENMEESYEQVVDEVSEYLASHIDTWFNDHPLPQLAKTNDEFKELKMSYESLAKEFQEVGLTNIADEINVRFSRLVDRTRVYRDYKNVKSEVTDKLKQLEALIKSGIYTASQADIFKQQLKELQNKIASFPSQNLSILQGCNFNDCSEEIKNLLSKVKESSQEMRDRFSMLLDENIASYSDLDKIENDITQVLRFFGNSDSNDDDYQDAKLLADEVSLLKEAYNDFRNGDYDQTGLDEAVDTWTKKIQTALNEDSIYDDSEVLHVLAEEVSEKKVKYGSDWISSMEDRFSNCHSANEYYDLLTKLEAGPVFLSEKDKLRKESLIAKTHEVISVNRVNYLLELFESLSEEEKEMFLKKAGLS